MSRRALVALGAALVVLAGGAAAVLVLTGGETVAEVTASTSTAAPTTTAAPTENRSMTSSAAARIAALSSSGPGRRVERDTPGRDSTSTPRSSNPATAMKPRSRSGSFITEVLNALVSFQPGSSVS